MMSAPVARTDSGFIALTVAAVPTGMNAGVRISPRRIAMRPVRAFPSRASMVNAKRGGSEPIDERKPRLGIGRHRADGRVAVVVDRVRQAGGQAVADLRLEPGGGEHAGRDRIYDHGGRAAAVGDHVGILRQLERLGDLPVEIHAREAAEAAFARTVEIVDRAPRGAGLDRQLERVFVEYLVAEPAGQRIARREALEAVALVLRQRVGEQVAVDLVTRLVRSMILLARGSPVAALVVSRGPEPVLPVHAGAVERERQRDADIVAVARGLKRADLAGAAPVVEQPGAAQLGVAARLLGGGDLALAIQERGLQRVDLSRAIGMGLR